MIEDQWIRARSTEQKKKRIQEIITATERLYNKYSYEKITFVQIAEEAGFTRSNLYKYFNSKEEIFLEFLKSDLKIWKKDIINNLNQTIVVSVNEFSAIWVEVLNKNKRLIELISILYEHLEKHASYESLLSFKKKFSTDLKKVTESLVDKIQGFNSEKVIEFINLQSAFGIGLYQMTDLSENQKTILELSEYAHYKVDFNEKYIQATKYILQGLLNN